VQAAAYPKIGQAVFAVDGAKAYPDATGTLRLSLRHCAQLHGERQAGGPIHGVRRPLRAVGSTPDKAPFDLAPRWPRRRIRSIRKTPFDFVSTNDIVGGNSGSPVVNKKGEVVGLIFDGNIQSLPGLLHLSRRHQSRRVGRLARDSRSAAQGLQGERHRRRNRREEVGMREPLDRSGPSSPEVCRAGVLLPLWAPEPTRAGALLLYAGAVTEAVQGFRRRTAASQRQAWFGAGLTLLLGILLSNIGWVAGAAITIIVAIPFAIDAMRYAGLAIRNVSRGESPTRAVAAAAGNLAVTVGLFLLGRFAFNWVIAAAAGMRLAGTAVNLVSAPVYTEDDADESVIADIGIDRPERLTETVDRIQREEAHRSNADTQWIIALLFVLFMIHVSPDGLRSIGARHRLAACGGAG
jgi:hypothetical protein